MFKSVSSLLSRWIWTGCFWGMLAGILGNVAPDISLWVIFGVAGVGAVAMSVYLDLMERR